MTAIECPWEDANLGCKVSEICVGNNDSLDIDIIKAIETSHDYVVIKIPTCRTDINFTLADMGYSFVECQITYEKRHRDFVLNDRLMARILKSMTVELVTDRQAMAELLENITEDMFVSDRIYLDPAFGSKYTVRRYKNWSMDMFDQGKNVYKITVGGRTVSYTINHIDQNGDLVASLGGTFANIEGIALGATHLLSYYNLAEQGVPFRKFITKVSSNNVPMIKIYNKLGFEQTKFEYVFAKHILHK